ncbi:MAG: WD40 repeat domain-containing protein, partial [Thermoanaerobaculia bacterium]|nr:WD40 repeat domain-containing protein [Thermoanaerobaculia bacterium]
MTDELIQKIENEKIKTQTLLKGSQLVTQAFEQKNKNITYAVRSLEASENIYPQNVLAKKYKSEIFSDTTLAYYTRKLPHSDAILGAVAVSADGRRWVTGSRDGSARFWDQGQARLRFPGPSNHEVFALDMTPDARYVVITYRNKNLIGTGKSYLWDLEQPKAPAQVFEERISIIHSVAISDDGRFFITGSNDGKARLYQNGKKDLIGTFDCGGTVKGLALSPDARFVFTANDEKSAVLWTIDGKKIAEFSGRYTAAAMSKDAEYLVAGSAEGLVNVWKRTGCDTCYHLAQTLETAHSERIFSVAMSSDGRNFATGSMDNTAKLWALGNNRPVQVFTGDGADVYSVDITPNGKYIISGCGD